MDNIVLEATDRTPGVDFNFGANTFFLRGESYPEDINEFYGPIMSKLDEHLSELEGAKVRFNFELTYFNSSSAKVLMGLFEKLDEAAEEGNTVHIVWSYDESDDNMEELGEEYCEDLEHATYELLAVEEE